MTCTSPSAEQVLHVKQAMGQSFNNMCCVATSHLSDGNNEGVPEQALILDLPLHVCLVVLDLQQSLHMLKMPRKVDGPIAAVTQTLPVLVGSFH